MHVKSFLAAALFASFATASTAATITDVGTFAGSTDFTNSTGGDLVSQYNFNYYANNSTSEWVWDQNLRAPNVTLTHTFDLTGYDLATASLSGIWAIDNVGRASLNGSVFSAIGFGRASFTRPTTYSVSSGFVAGLNTVSFQVRNIGRYSALGNPAAVRAEVLVTADLATVPLPASGLLVLSSLGALALLRKRKIRPVRPAHNV